MKFWYGSDRIGAGGMGGDVRVKFVLTVTELMKSGELQVNGNKIRLERKDLHQSWKSIFFKITVVSLGSGLREYAPGYPKGFAKAKYPVYLDASSEAGCSLASLDGLDLIPAGALKELNLTGNDLGSLSGLEAYHALKRLWAGACSLRAPPLLSSSSLVLLHLPGNALTAFPSPTLASAPQLKELDLSNNLINEDLAPLLNCVALEIVRLDNNKFDFTPVELAATSTEVLPRLKSLQEFTMTACPASAVPNYREILILSATKSLKSLNGVPISKAELKFRKSIAKPLEHAQSMAEDSTPLPSPSTTPVPSSPIASASMSQFQANSPSLTKGSDSRPLDLASPPGSSVSSPGTPNLPSSPPDTPSIVAVATIAARAAAETNGGSASPVMASSPFMTPVSSPSPSVDGKGPSAPPVVGTRREHTLVEWNDWEKLLFAAVDNRQEAPAQLALLRSAISAFALTPLSTRTLRFRPGTDPSVATKQVTVALARFLGSSEKERVFAPAAGALMSALAVPEGGLDVKALEAILAAAEDSIRVRRALWSASTRVVVPRLAVATASEAAASSLDLTYVPALVTAAASEGSLITSLTSHLSAMVSVTFSDNFSEDANLIKSMMHLDSVEASAGEAEDERLVATALGPCLPMFLLQIETSSQPPSAATLNLTAAAASSTNLVSVPDLVSADAPVHKVIANMVTAQTSSVDEASRAAAANLISRLVAGDLGAASAYTQKLPVAARLARGIVATLGAWKATREEVLGLAPAMSTLQALLDASPPPVDETSSSSDSNSQFSLQPSSGLSTDGDIDAAMAGAGVWSAVQRTGYVAALCAAASRAGTAPAAITSAVLYAIAALLRTPYCTGEIRRGVLRSLGDDLGVLMDLLSGGSTFKCAAAATESWDAENSVPSRPSSPSFGEKSSQQKPQSAVSGVEHPDLLALLSSGVAVLSAFMDTPAPTPKVSDQADKKGDKDDEEPKYDDVDALEAVANAVAASDAFGREAMLFNLLAVSNDGVRLAAVDALTKVDPSQWTPDEVSSLVHVLTDTDDITEGRTELVLRGVLATLSHLARSDSPAGTALRSPETTGVLIPRVWTIALVNARRDTRSAPLETAERAALATACNDFLRSAAAAVGSGRWPAASPHLMGSEAMGHIQALLAAEDSSGPLDGESGLAVGIEGVRLTASTEALVSALATARVDGVSMARIARRLASDVLGRPLAWDGGPLTSAKGASVSADWDASGVFGVALGLPRDPEDARTEALAELSKSESITTILSVLRKVLIADAEWDEEDEHEDEDGTGDGDIYGQSAGMDLDWARLAAMADPAAARATRRRARRRDVARAGRRRGTKPWESRDLIRVAVTAGVAAERLIEATSTRGLSTPSPHDGRKKDSGWRTRGPKMEPTALAGLVEALNHASVFGPSPAVIEAQNGIDQGRDVGLSGYVHAPDEPRGPPMRFGRALASGPSVPGGGSVRRLLVDTTAEERGAITLPGSAVTSRRDLWVRTVTSVIPKTSALTSFMGSVTGFGRRRRRQQSGSETVGRVDVDKQEFTDGEDSGPVTVTHTRRGLVDSPPNPKLPDSVSDAVDYFEGKTDNRTEGRTVSSSSHRRAPSSATSVATGMSSRGGTGGSLPASLRRRRLRRASLALLRLVQVMLEAAPQSAELKELYSRPAVELVCELGSSPGRDVSVAVAAAEVLAALIARWNGGCALADLSLLDVVGSYLKTLTESLGAIDAAQQADADSDSDAEDNGVPSAMLRATGSSTTVGNAIAKTSLSKAIGKLTSGICAVVACLDTGGWPSFVHAILADSAESTAPRGADVRPPNAEGEDEWVHVREQSQASPGPAAKASRRPPRRPSLGKELFLALEEVAKANRTRSIVTGSGPGRALVAASLLGVLLPQNVLSVLSPALLGGPSPPEGSDSRLAGSVYDHRTVSGLPIPPDHPRAAHRASPADEAALDAVNAYAAVLALLPSSRTGEVYDRLLRLMMTMPEGEARSGAETAVARLAAASGRVRYGVALSRLLARETKLRIGRVTETATVVRSDGQTLVAAVSTAGFHLLVPAKKSCGKCPPEAFCPDGPTHLGSWTWDRIRGVLGSASGSRLRLFLDKEVVTLECNNSERLTVIARELARGCGYDERVDLTDLGSLLAIVEAAGLGSGDLDSVSCVSPVWTGVGEVIAPGGTGNGRGQERMLLVSDATMAAAGGLPRRRLAVLTTEALVTVRESPDLWPCHFDGKRAAYAKPEFRLPLKDLVRFGRPSPGLALPGAGLAFEFARPTGKISFTLLFGDDTVRGPWERALVALSSPATLQVRGGARGWAASRDEPGRAVGDDSEESLLFAGGEGRGRTPRSFIASAGGSLRGSE